ncbi:glycine cleavage system protein GcvH [Salinadaptatus halalkaliphilus]|uniref:Probable glycine cleavage system H protein n=1 Tax=Salinadaptatus halalkaliphilus TaxID=2419781 RepID=A0A4V3VKU8_9EURY|nr:glycine cleavage system protein GcvH [Salinadaptatus halalkaliphilus]THE63177.1 glycine cleavage system protein GcvH [Salinadaptatus halalkaliphilus]
MNFQIPDELQYAASHEWVDRRDEVVRIGITDFAQDELGDIVFVELPAEGDTVDRDEAFGLVESIKAISDVYAPVAGTVVEINTAVREQPELINEHPFEDGWLIELEPTGEFDHLLEPAEYRAQL